jgi:phasin protein
MSTTRKDKPSNKSSQRNRKADRRGRKHDPEQNPKLDQQNEEKIGTALALADANATGEAASSEFASSEPSARVDVPPLIAEAVAADAPSMELVALADNGSIGFQTIANAYWSYARRSFQQTAALVEKLMGARSFDRAIDAQTEFTRQTYANLVVESQNICELYGRLARQIFRSWQGFALGMRNK